MNDFLLDFFTSGTSTAQSICSAILKFLRKKSEFLDSLVAVDFDGTVVNTR